MASSDVTQARISRVHTTRCRLGSGRTELPRSHVVLPLNCFPHNITRTPRHHTVTSRASEVMSLRSVSSRTKK